MGVMSEEGVLAASRKYPISAAGQLAGNPAYVEFFTLSKALRQWLATDSSLR